MAIDQVLSCETIHEIVNAQKHFNAPYTANANVINIIILICLLSLPHAASLVILLVFSQ